MPTYTWCQVYHFLGTQKQHKIPILWVRRSGRTQKTGQELCVDSGVLLTYYCSVFWFIEVQNMPCPIKHTHHCHLLGSVKGAARSNYMGYWFRRKKTVARIKWGAGLAVGFPKESPTLVVWNSRHWGSFSFLDFWMDEKFKKDLKLHHFPPSIHTFLFSAPVKLAPTLSGSHPTGNVLRFRWFFLFLGGGKNDVLYEFLSNKKSKENWQIFSHNFGCNFLFCVCYFCFC